MYYNGTYAILFAIRKLLYFSSLTLDKWPGRAFAPSQSAKTRKTRESVGQSRNIGESNALVWCIPNATRALPRGGRYATYDEIYGVSSFESTCALLKFSSDQCVGSSSDILNS